MSGRPVGGRRGPRLLDRNRGRGRPRPPSGAAKSTSVAARDEVEVLGASSRPSTGAGARRRPAGPSTRAGHPRSDVVRRRLELETGHRPDRHRSACPPRPSAPVPATGASRLRGAESRLAARIGAARVGSRPSGGGASTISGSAALARERGTAAAGAVGSVEAGVEEDEVAAPRRAGRGVGAAAEVAWPSPAAPAGRGGRRAISRSPAILASCSSASSSRDAARSSSTSIIRISWLPENWSANSLTD